MGAEIKSLAFQVGRLIRLHPKALLAGCFLLVGIGAVIAWNARGSNARAIAGIQRLTVLVLEGMKIGAKAYDFDKSNARLLSPVKWERVSTRMAPTVILTDEGPMVLVHDIMIVDSSNKAGQPIRITWDFGWFGSLEKNEWSLSYLANEHGN